MVSEIGPNSARLSQAIPAASQSRAALRRILADSSAAILRSLSRRGYPTGQGSRGSGCSAIRWRSRGCLGPSAPHSAPLPAPLPNHPLAPQASSVVAFQDRKIVLAFKAAGGLDPLVAQL